MLVAVDQPLSFLSSLSSSSRPRPTSFPPPPSSPLLLLTSCWYCCLFTFPSSSLPALSSSLIFYILLFYVFGRGPFWGSLCLLISEMLLVFSFFVLYCNVHHSVTYFLLLNTVFFVIFCLIGLHFYLLLWLPHHFRSSSSCVVNNLSSWLEFCILPYFIAKVIFVNCRPASEALCVVYKRLYSWAFLTPTNILSCTDFLWNLCFSHEELSVAPVV